MKPTTSRRSFISNLATVATVAAVAPIANALPLDKTDWAKATLAENEARARNAILNGIPLRWESQTALFGPVSVGYYLHSSFLGTSPTIYWRFGWSPAGGGTGIVNTEAEARAAIQAEWDKLCSAEPVAAQPAPKVKALEWSPWENGYLIARPASNQYLVIHGEAPKYHITGSTTGGYLPMCDTLESAKAAAQAHWNSIVLGALDA